VGAGVSMEEEQERKRIRKLVMEAELLQAKRSLKFMGIFLAIYFAVQGALTLYRYLGKIL
jgi:hypothetical protein